MYALKCRFDTLGIFGFHFVWLHRQLNEFDSTLFTEMFLYYIYLLRVRIHLNGSLLFHSDRGCQFTAKAFRKHLDELNIVQSFSAKGHPYDNAVMECFFKYLKKEETNRRTYSSFDELKLSIFQYINGFYNSFRPHSHNNGLSPDQAEMNFL